MQRALDETNRRRAKQVRYNQEHDIEPVSIVKAVRDLTDQVTAQAVAEPRGEYRAGRPADLPKDELQRVIRGLEKQMQAAAEALEFEKAAALRDEIYDLRQVLADQEQAAPWQRARVLSGGRN
jgi:excinuclease ABC subunit B